MSVNVTDSNSTNTTPPIFGSCDIRPFVDPYADFANFTNTPPILMAHNGIPRLGHTTDIMYLVTGTKEQAEDYLMGVLVSSIIVFCFFLVWIIILCVLKGLGPNRVGFLSGKRQPLPPRPTNDADEMAKEEKDIDGKEPLQVVGQEQHDNIGENFNDIKEDHNNIDDKNKPPQFVMMTTTPGSSNPQDPEMTEDGNDLFEASEPTPNDPLLIGDKDNGRDGFVDDDAIGPRDDDPTGGHLSPLPPRPSVIPNGVDNDGDDDGGYAEHDNSHAESNDTFPTNHGTDDVPNMDHPAMEATTTPLPTTTTTTTATIMTPGEEWDVMYRKKIQEQRWLKGVVFVACTTVVAMAALMAGRGIGSLRGSIDYSQTSLFDAQQLIGIGVNFINELITDITNFKGNLLYFLENANRICPALYPNGICTNLTNPNTCDANGVVLNQSTMEAFITTLDTEGAAVTQLEEWVTTLLDISNTANDASNTLSTLDWLFYAAVGFDLVVGLLAASMIFGLFLPNIPWIIKCLQNRFLFPLFLFCTALSFIFAVAFLITSLVLADSCVDGPSQRILNATEYWFEKSGQPISQTVQLWLSQCTAEPQTFVDFESYYYEAEDTLAKVDRALANATVILADECGANSTDTFDRILASMAHGICSGLDIIRFIRIAFNCQTWLPLYYTAVYDAVCYNGTDGGWSIAATQFMVVFMACVIMTFRAVFWELQILDDSKQGDDDDGDDDGDREVEKGGNHPAKDYSQEKSMEGTVVPEGATEDYATAEPNYEAPIPTKGYANAEVC